MKRLNAFSFIVLVFFGSGVQAKSLSCLPFVSHSSKVFQPVRGQWIIPLGINEVRPILSVETGHVLVAGAGGHGVLRVPLREIFYTSGYKTSYSVGQRVSAGGVIYTLIGINPFSQMAALRTLEGSIVIQSLHLLGFSAREAKGLEVTSGTFYGDRVYIPGENVRPGRVVDFDPILNLLAVEVKLGQIEYLAQESLGLAKYNIGMNSRFIGEQVRPHDHSGVLHTIVAFNPATNQFFLKPVESEGPVRLYTVFQFDSN